MVTTEDFASVNVVVGGAAPIGPTLINGLIQKANKPIQYQEGYGLTELSPCEN